MYRSWGWIGVDLFFVISGYLITSILLASRERPGYYLNFYARRGLRIWPLYYLLLFFVFVASPHLGEWANQRLDLRVYHWWYYVTYMQNLILPHLGSFALVITWSLCVEEQFYLVWPWMVRLCSRRGLQATAIGVLAAEPVLRYVLQRWESPMYGYWTFTRLDAIAAGALIALRPRALKHGWIAAPFAYWLLWHKDYNLSYTALALTFGWLVSWTVENGSRFLRWAPLCFIGKISYGLYIYHTIVFVVYWSTPLYKFADGLPWKHAWHLFFQVLMPIPIAAVSWYALEEPILRFKKFFEFGRKTTKDVPALGLQAAEAAD